MIIPHFINGQLFTKGVITTIITFDLVRVDHIFREHVNRSSDLLEQMTSPNDFSGIRRHISHNGRVSLLVSEDSLDSIKFSGVVVQNRIVFRCQLVLK